MNCSHTRNQAIDIANYLPPTSTEGFYDAHGPLGHPDYITFDLSDIDAYV